MEHTQSHLCCIVFSQGYSSTTVLQSSHFQRRLTSDLGSALLFFIRVNVASTVKQGHVCCLQVGSRGSLFSCYSLSLHFRAMREENETHLSWVSLFSQPFVCPSFCFYLSNTHIHKLPERCAHAAPSIFRRALNGWLAFACIDWVHVCPIFQRSWWLY